MSNASYCGQCGQANSSNNNFCLKCGSSLAIANSMSPATVKSKSGRSKARNKSIDDKFECIRCDTVVSVGVTKCPKCGLDFFPEDKDSEEDKIDLKDDSDKFECIRCDTVVSVGTTKCPKCGLDFFPEGNGKEDEFDSNDDEPIRRPTMSNQVQCPNCGGYKLDTELTEMDSETGKKYKPNAGINLLLIIGGFIVFGLVTKVIGAISNNEGVSLVAGFVSWLVFLSWGANKETERKKKRKYNLYNFYCNLCGYRWTWREGSPYPKINVRPELIAQGEQVLEEKRKQQQRQQDDAALHYLLNKDK